MKVSEVSDVFTRQIEKDLRCELGAQGVTQDATTQLGTKVEEVQGLTLYRLFYET